MGRCFLVCRLRYVLMLGNNLSELNFFYLKRNRKQAEGDCSRVRRVRHGSFQADGSLINHSEKGGIRFLCISTLSKSLVSLDKGHGPRRQQQTGCRMRGRIGRLSPYAFGERHRYDLRELVTYRPSPSLESFAALDRLYEALAPSSKSDEGALFCNQSMSEQT